MLDFSHLICFQTVYRTLSISKAAQKLNLSKASISKKIHSLELELGGALFMRSTRKITPTIEGDLLFEQMEDLNSKVSEISTLFKGNSVLKGKIRVTCSHSMAQRFVGKLLLSFQEIYPDITIDLISTDNVLDPLENNIDISLRVNPFEQSLLVGKRIGVYQLHLVAHPKLLKTVHVKQPEDLNKLPFFSIDAHSNAIFEKTGKKLNSILNDRKLLMNDSVLVGQFIRDGLGIGIRSNWDIKNDLKDGNLKLVLPQWPLKKSGDVWLLSHKSKIKIPRVQTLFNYLEEHLKEYF